MQIKIDYVNYAKIQAAHELLKEVHQQLADETPKEVLTSANQLQFVVDGIFFH